MRTLAECRQLYEQTLLADLKILEQERINVFSKLVFTLVPLAILTAVICGWIIFQGGLVQEDNPIFFVLVVSGMLAAGIYYFLTRNYVHNFKNTILPKIVCLIDENLSYAPDQCISQSEFCQCQIFLRTPDRYKGEDLVSGTIGQTTLKFSEIHAQYVTRGRKGRKHYHTIFKGLLFVADFNKKFSGRTFILPDAAETFLGGVIGSTLQSWNAARPPLVKLEDPVFEKYFVVYGDDQVEARYILSTSLMKRITDFRNKTKKDISLSFLHSNVYVAIPYSRNLFEPRVFRTILDFEPIQQYFEDLELAVGIVEDLNLNLRIWSKQ